MFRHDSDLLFCFIKLIPIYTGVDKHNLSSNQVGHKTHFGADFKTTVLQSPPVFRGADEVLTLSSRIRGRKKKPQQGKQQ